MSFNRKQDRPQIHNKTLQALIESHLSQRPKVEPTLISKSSSFFERIEALELKCKQIEQALSGIIDDDLK